MIRFSFTYFIRALTKLRVRIIVIAVGDHPGYKLSQLVMNEKTDIARLHTRANIRKVVDYAYKAACIKANVPGKYVFL